MKKLVPLVAWLSAACNTDFTEAFEVDEPKLMAARIEVTDAPERPWPRVGDDFTMRVLVARSTKDPTRSLDKQLDGAISVCLGGKLPDGSLFCVAEIPMSVLQGEKKNQTTSFEELQIPLSFGDADPRKLAGTDSVLVFGAVCVEGKAQRVNGKVAGVDPADELFRCVDNDRAELKGPLAFTNVVTVDYPDDEFENTNPSFACDPGEDSLCNAGSERDDEERRGGAFVLVKPKPKNAAKKTKRVVVEWPEVLPSPTKPLSYQGCADDPRFDALKVEVDSGEHLIRIRFDDSDRQEYTFQKERYNKLITVTQREELLIAHSATKDFGALSRYFSIVPRDASDQAAEAEIEFTPPTAKSDEAKAVTKRGSLVRFYFVVRDQRGGVDFTTRSLCLVPASAKDP